MVDSLQTLRADEDPWLPGVVRDVRGRGVNKNHAWGPDRHLSSMVADMPKNPWDAWVDVVFDVMKKCPGVLEKFSRWPCQKKELSLDG